MHPLRTPGIARHLCLDTVAKCRVPTEIVRRRNAFRGPEVNPSGRNSPLWAHPGRFSHEPTLGIRHISTLKPTQEAMSPALASLYDPPLFPDIDEVQANAKVIKCLQQQKYGAAKSLITNMLKNGVKVAQHPLYEEAAFAFLQAHATEYGAFREYASWLKFAPDAHHPLARPRGQDPFPLVSDWLFKSGIPAKKLSFISLYVLLLADKGYHYIFVPEASRLVAKYGIPYKARFFFHRLLHRVLMYYRHRQETQNSPTLAFTAPDSPPRLVRFDEQPLEDPLTVIANYWQVAVEACIHVGNLKAAMFLVATRREVALPDRTYSLLLDALHAQGMDDRYCQAMRSMEECREADRKRRLLEVDPRKEVQWEDDLVGCFDESDWWEDEQVGWEDFASDAAFDKET
ncbi:hypothetical protein CC2G_014101 [Coprinopsis cinerea AmutBmut pab1-1]|nr:hypothetical protein CC2G_014101 [Coprinopsis cinerea AmutBmut pab1-1]